MIKKLICLICVTGFTQKSNGQSIGVSQNPNSINCIKSISYVFGDSIVRATFFIKEGGFFFFNFYNQDSFLSNDYKKIDQADTIYYYSNKFYSGFENIEYDTIIKNVHYSSSTLNEELKYSYILSKLDTSRSNNGKDTVIYVLYPLDELNQSNEYSLLKLVLNNEKSELYFSNGKSKDCNGFELVNGKRKTLSKKEVKSVRGFLGKLNYNSMQTCTRPGNPWLFECHDGSHIIGKGIMSEYCKRLSKKNKKNVIPYFNIRGLLSRVMQ